MCQRYESYPWRMDKAKKKPSKQPKAPAANLVHESMIKAGTVHGGPQSSVRFSMEGAILSLAIRCCTAVALAMQNVISVELF